MYWDYCLNCKTEKWHYRFHEGGEWWAMKQCRDCGRIAHQDWPPRPDAVPRPPLPGLFWVAGGAACVGVAVVAWMVWWAWG